MRRSAPPKNAGPTPQNKKPRSRASFVGSGRPGSLMGAESYGAGAKSENSAKGLLELYPRVRPHYRIFSSRLAHILATSSP